MMRSRIYTGAFRRLNTANFHTTRSRLQSHSNKIDVDALLQTPTWSVESLLPAKQADTTSPISSKQLHHLLRLSALPPPKDAQEEATMLATLSQQLHFVNDIRKVDTTGIVPLQSIRDETDAGIKESEIGLDDLEDAFANEESKGHYYKRTRRIQEPPTKGEHAHTDNYYTWDVLGNAPKRVGRYFVVDGGAKES